MGVGYCLGRRSVDSRSSVPDGNSLGRLVRSLRLCAEALRPLELSAGGAAHYEDREYCCGDAERQGSGVESGGAAVVAQGVSREEELAGELAANEEVSQSAHQSVSRAVALLWRQASPCA
jgi:hypothetical protein